MAKQIYVNLPVTDLARSKAFYVALGLTVNPKFSDDRQAVCVALSDDICLMLLQRDYFQTFTDRKICDTQRELQVLLATNADDRAHVDSMVAAALANGGTEAGPARDYGFMYQRSFADPDGHVFEVLHLDEAQFPGPDVPVG
ncbi:MAG: VOC family protein [Pseudomonadota bacterium]|jgi:predicted lactoylglutathione lyase|nr:MAG: hypothetical protein DIU62_05115 [Pseudomonadota bacterium]